MSDQHKQIEQHNIIARSLLQIIIKDLEISSELRCGVTGTLPPELQAVNSAALIRRLKDVASFLN